MRDFSVELGALGRRLGDADRYLDLEGKRKRLAELEVTLARPDLWDDADEARAVTTEFGRVNDDVKLLDGLRARLVDAETLYQLAVEESDDSVEPELTSVVEDLDRRLSDLDLLSLFTGEHDEGDAVCEIHAGEGGTDAQDWAEMMVRMYLRWAERRGFEVEVEEETPGQEAGILSATFIVRGRYAYGLLSGERGVHRLYRISPFDAQARRQTSYAALELTPFIEDVWRRAWASNGEIR